jgi:hypothetical protein
VVAEGAEAELPDTRKHRGPHPEDRQLFAADVWPRLREATRDLSWLLSRGYAAVSALKIVGDRYSLDARQRVAVSRCACGEGALAARQRHRMEPADIGRRALWIDGYNALTTIEAALSGGVLLHARDGCYRDMASMHGTYRKVHETIPAIELLGAVLSEWRVANCRWLLDQPVSNSGRLKALMRRAAETHGWDWQIELVADPDRVLCDADSSAEIVATSDSQVLDRARGWLNLARIAVDSRITDAWIVDLSQ